MSLGMERDEQVEVEMTFVAVFIPLQTPTVHPMLSLRTLIPKGP